MTIPNEEEKIKEILSRYNAEILNKFQDEYLMKKGPGCEEILFPVLEKATKDFIDIPEDGQIRKYNVRDAFKEYARTAYLQGIKAAEGDIFEFVADERDKVAKNTDEFNNLNDDYKEGYWIAMNTVMKKLEETTAVLKPSKD